MKKALDRQSILLLAVNGLFVLSGALSGTFLNVFLWKSKQDYAMIGWFTVSQQIALGLTFWIAGKWVKEHNKMNALRVGTALSGLFYLLVLLAGKAAVWYIWPLGLLLGAALGMFWLAFNVVTFEVTDPGNRDMFNGWLGLIGSVCGIVGPWFSGWVISRMQDNAGYRLIFTLSLMIYGIAVVFSFFLNKRKLKGHYQWGTPLLELKRPGSPWRRTALGLVFQGLREGVYSFLIVLLVYEATQQEWKLGQFSLITSAISLVTFWVAGKWLKPRYRYAGMLIGTLLLAGFMIPLLWSLQYGMLLVMGIGMAAFVPLYMIPMVSVTFDLMGTNEESANSRVELMVLRELCLMCGRLAGILLYVVILSISDAPRTITWLIVGLGFSPVLGWLFMRRQLKETTG
ncbi:MFS transporter [Paenibacillus physcomitrellae]|uniref:MFS transporter n=1 Tax=Paenibacillus physcomitrellae TaxID=1619311 RepID=A0ABQ1FTF9_9BACL|nr:MFS transporter [Paenibacillus physcomitrellae]GGA29032.1 MFS transporter [Paenibacillus physcomitrellae]